MCHFVDLFTQVIYNTNHRTILTGVVLVTSKHPYFTQSNYSTLKQKQSPLCNLGFSALLEGTTVPQYLCDHELLLSGFIAATVPLVAQLHH